METMLTGTSGPGSPKAGASGFGWSREQPRECFWVRGLALPLTSYSSHLGEGEAGASPQWVAGAPGSERQHIHLLLTEAE